MPRLRLAALFCIITSVAVQAASNTLPDDVVLKDGRQLKGLIVKKTPDQVVLQMATSEITVPSESIRRINDLPDDNVYFTEITQPGELPNWRSIVQDLRSDDSVKTFEQIPATAINVGYLRNIPYLSFRINEASEMNVYGDPKNPVAVEFGVYGKGKRSNQRQRIIREFIAGHLHSRDEVRALYQLNLKEGGEIKCGKLAMKITPPEAEDSFGGKWFCIYDPARLDKARVSDAKYAQVTKPFDAVNEANGKLRRQLIAEDADWLSGTVNKLTGKVPEVRGFYRDKNGVFRLIGFGKES